MSLIEKIDAEIAMYQQRIENRQGNCYHDESERLLRFEERLHEAERIKEIILSEQKEPCIPDYDSYAFACKNCHTILGNLYLCEEPKFCHECENPISWKFNIEDGVIIKTEKAD